MLLAAMKLPARIVQVDEHVKHALRKINEYRRKQAEKIPAENEPVSGWDPADASPETDGAG